MTILAAQSSIVAGDEPATTRLDEGGVTLKITISGLLKFTVVADSSQSK